MAIKEGADAAVQRWKELELLQTEYAAFAPFLDDCMDLLGFSTSPLQQDIGSYIAYGPQYLMVQAQRGQAKTTIAAIYSVWELIHNPHHRVLVLSAGGTQANEISTLIVRIIMSMDVLECMRPDPSNGDRTSVEAFDIHYTLKGIDKSPSVSCIGITGNLQGKRADLLIPDDIESMKNSRTATMRELLMDLTRDFTSICSTGRILYLGTPQSVESIYNTLPARGFTVRIWPGRYPTFEQLANYGDMLAPYIRSRLERNPALMAGGGLLSDQGQPTDPTYLTEEVLTKKEMDQGPSYFQLQHMLSTALSDAARFPLKLEDIIVMNLGRGAKENNQSRFPLTVTRALGQGFKDIAINSTPYKLGLPAVQDTEYQPLQGTIMYVDPAGGGKNGDETAYAVTGFLNGNVFVLAVGGLQGGYGMAQMEALADVALNWRVNEVVVEKNMGYGAFVAVWLPILKAKHICKVEEDFVTGQKELRIVETLEPVIARGSLILNEACIEQDQIDTTRYEANRRILYSLFHQLSKMTRERDALIHDDKADALEGAVRYWSKYIAIDQEQALKKLREQDWKNRTADIMGHNRYGNPKPRGRSVLDKYTRSYT